MFAEPATSGPAWSGQASSDPACTGKKPAPTGFTGTQREDN